MLLYDQDEPFAARNFFENIEVVTTNDFTHVFTLLAQDAGENSKAVLTQDAIEFRKELHDDFRSQIAEQEMHRIALHRVQGSAKRIHISFRIPFNVGLSNLHGYRIDVTGKDLALPILGQRAIVHPVDGKRHVHTNLSAGSNSFGCASLAGH